MRLRALVRRLVLPPIAAGLAVSGLALPARADSLVGFPLLLLNITDTVTVIDGQAKTVKFDVYNLGGADAKNVVIGFADGPGAVPADLGFVPPAGCSATACTLDKLAAGERHSYSFTVQPDVASKTNLTSHFDVTTTVGGEEHDKVQLTVVRTTKKGVDLEVADIKDMSLNRGQSVDLPVAIKNTGNAETGPLGLVVAAQPGLEALLNYRNCEADEEFGGIVCVIDEPLAPGESATLSSATPAKLKVGVDTPGPADYFADVVAVGLTDKFVASFAKRNAGKSGADLELQKARSFAALNKGIEDDLEDGIEDDLNPADNVAEFIVKVGRSEADSKAIGGVFHGTAGDEVTVKVGTQNLGPTATVQLSTKWVGYVHVKLPTNVKLTEADEMCLPGTSPTKVDLSGKLDSRDWVCLVLDQLPKGGKSLFSFQAMIQEGSHDAGFVQVDGGVQDSKHKNDRAALTVDGGTGGEGGGLPITGPSALSMAGGGLVLLAAGVFAFRIARRRRIVTVVE
ncbi:hypothetical protein GCM10010168_66620 [Actinoplanes ianthinogenes]|uniref:LPXTG-motif cell wall-anchored protein n=1 Tax=Actinoplanes ianthinogenes TaxID=122358 RepID=A0ABM7LWZ3_9ACTN|nr:hypothetical protein [Actinoplanes ianthinogenes]BCJ43859.1 hypothetical protein Aiant_45160 [Actinoplanes ianthinogenes]GGR38845.1 hypothetical protein GCM10010168_66620 [Actinoplanes ianthinogenes]